MRGLFRRFAADSAGTSPIEYSMLAVLIAITLIGAFTVLGGDLINVFGVGAGGPSEIMAGASSDFG